MYGVRFRQKLDEGRLASGRISENIVTPKIVVHLFCASNILQAFERRTAAKHHRTFAAEPSVVNHSMLPRAVVLAVSSICVNLRNLWIFLHLFFVRKVHRLLIGLSCFFFMSAFK